MKRIWLQNRERHSRAAQYVVRFGMEPQQFACAACVRSHSGELDQMLYLGALRGYDKVLLPLNKAFCDRSQKECLLHALQGRLECLRSIKVARRHLDVRPIELASLG